MLPCAQAKLRWPDGAYDEEEDDAHAVLAAAELLDAQDWMLGEELLAAHEADDEPPELGVFDELVDSDDLSAYLAEHDQQEGGEADAGAELDWELSPSPSMPRPAAARGSAIAQHPQPPPPDSRFTQQQLDAQLAAALDEEGDAALRASLAEDGDDDSELLAAAADPPSRRRCRSREPPPQQIRMQQQQQQQQRTRMMTRMRRPLSASGTTGRARRSSCKARSSRTTISTWARPRHSLRPRERRGGCRGGGRWPPMRMRRARPPSARREGGASEDDVDDVDLDAEAEDWVGDEADEEELRHYAIENAGHIGQAELDPTAADWDDLEDLLAEVMAVEEEGEGDDDLDSSSSSSSGAASEEEAALIDEDEDDEDLPLQTLGDDALDAELSSHEQQLGGGLEAHLPEASDLLDDELISTIPSRRGATTLRPPFRSIRYSRRTILDLSDGGDDDTLLDDDEAAGDATADAARELSSRSRTKQPTARSQRGLATQWWP